MDPAAITPPAFSLTCTPSAFERIELSAAVGKVSPESESDETYLATTEEQSPAATKNYFREAAPARRGSLLEPSPAATKNPFREDALSHGAFSRSPEPSPAATNAFEERTWRTSRAFSRSRGSLPALQPKLHTLPGSMHRISCGSLGSIDSFIALSEEAKKLSSKPPDNSVDDFFTDVAFSSRLGRANSM
ncbi:hypothetical protein T484DRAFT_1845969, partial [Baffinella frigidus]